MTHTAWGQRGVGFERDATTGRLRAVPLVGGSAEVVDPGPAWTAGTGGARWCGAVAAYRAGVQATHPDRRWPATWGQVARTVARDAAAWAQAKARCHETGLITLGVVERPEPGGRLRVLVGAVVPVVRPGRPHWRCRELHAPSMVIPDDRAGTGRYYEAALQRQLQELAARLDRLRAEGAA